ncbi:MAG: hypothetical protein EKK63_02340 [Acinetobacter sp.]|uniref:hypothetical protein n=1 Tax=Acinetobacter sp. TaxID=472 RepID=UPI000FA8DFC1|nr:hypothetical protein [Acinetobacter sp.]RUP42156.1 MAG: hypothetical protein EKK63_02340 [Acinetobacter sp.]
MNHSNSHKIFIYRNTSFLAAAQGKDVRPFFAAGNQSIGSYYETINASKIGSGLTAEEEKLILPEILYIDSKELEFKKEVRLFYINLDTKIPFDTGLELEIGLLEDNNAPISASNLPIKPMDYIRYRHALKHPRVAKSPEEAEGQNNIWFYIQDKALTNKRKKAQAAIKDEAIQAYLEIKSSENKVQQALLLLGKNLSSLEEPAETELRKIAESSPQKFVDVVLHKDFEANYWIQSFLDAGVIKQVGGRFYDVEDDSKLAESKEDLVTFLKDDSSNSEKIGLLKARYQDKTIK